MSRLCVVVAVLVCACVPRPAHQRALADVRSLESRIDAFGSAFQEQEADAQDALDAAQASGEESAQLTARLAEMDLTLSALRERVEPLEAAEEAMRTWREHVVQGLTDEQASTYPLAEATMGLALEVNSERLFGAGGTTLSDDAADWMSGLAQLLADASLEACRVELIWSPGQGEGYEVPWARLGQRADALLAALRVTDVTVFGALREGEADTSVERVSFLLMPLVEDERAGETVDVKP